MRFWDTSAIVPLLLTEERSEEARSLLAEESRVIVSWTTEMECASAVARGEREGRIEEVRIRWALHALDRLRSGWSEVHPGDPVRESARRLLRTHPLRSADSLQLASALVISEYRPRSLPFVCLDDRLRVAASREGFTVLP